MKLIKVCVLNYILIVSISISYAQQDTIGFEEMSLRFKHQVLNLEHKIYRAGKDSVKNRLILKKATMLKKNGLIDKAFVEYNRLKVNDVNFFMAEKSLYNRIVISYAKSRFDMASNYLEKYDKFIPDTLRRDKIFLLKSLIYNLEEEYKIARTALKKYCSFTGDSLNVDSLYAFTENIKDPDKAVLLSSILPGMGQFYTGNIWQGINSFMVSAAMVGYSVYTFRKRMFTSMIFTGLNLFVAFYGGGKRNARSLAKQHNASIISGVNNLIIKRLEKK